MSSFRVIGRGRAGRSLATALGRAGWGLGGVLGREDDVEEAAHGVDLLVIAVPDDAVASVAASVAPVATTVVAHLAGSLGLDVLEPHIRRAALHPLASLPTPEVGAERLRGAWFAIAGDPLVQSVVDALDGRSFEVPTGVAPRITPPPRSRRITWSRCWRKSSVWRRAPTSRSTRISISYGPRWRTWLRSAPSRRSPAPPPAVTKPPSLGILPHCPTTSTSCTRCCRTRVGSWRRGSPDVDRRGAGATR